MKKVWLISAAAIVASSTLALGGCSSGGSGGASGGSGHATIEVETDMGSGTPELKALTSIAKEFESTHKNITLKLVPGTGETNYEAAIKVRLAAHNPPDIWMTHGWSVLRYGQFLAPLQDESWAKNLNPALKPAMVDEKGNLFALPTDIDVSGIMYNADVLKEAGIDPASITSWSAFDAACAKLKAEGISPLYVGGKSMAAAVADRLLPGGFSDSALKKMKSGTFVAKDFAKTLKLIANWKQAGYLNPDYSSANQTTMGDALARGQAAFEMGPTSIVNTAHSTNPKAQFGFIPIPSIDDNDTFLVAGERTAFGASKTGKHLAQAKEFLTFLAQPANETAMSAATASAPGLTNAKETKGILSSSFATYVTEKSTPSVPYFDRVYLPDGAWVPLGNAIDSVITGQSSVDAATQMMQQTYESLSAQAKANS
ncbi:ABC transporter substrate-binding protein [Microbacterium sp. STN6]|uniref:ABC transporter substrate-binding protein n=1 Tax=Microbacterium sp. STN6 TaxID=2995588 RepID=UPI002260C476|nr:ABC transporter substrate-binding protein [Microbacterium sp. STN6]MCX7522565.1 ABC transporter substrate-binding protein [Microbacterium sp. STN6]